MAADFRERRFPLTRTSAVAAVGSNDPAERARSFDVLVRAYFRPVYAHVRLKWGRAAEDARDLTQEFFARAFEKRWLASYDPLRARFRTYLKTCLDRFVADAIRDERRQKRGGGAMRLSLDFDLAEEELARLAPHGPGGADACFDAEWIRSLLGAAVDTLGALCVEKKKETYFAVFRRYALEREERGLSYADVARELGVSVTDVTNYLTWTRREFRRIVLEKLREVTATDDEFEAEARALLGDRA
jgi:RNA polymerase sigma factor (sigma-70 family)